MTDSLSSQHVQHAPADHREHRRLANHEIDLTGVHRPALDQRYQFTLADLVAIEAFFPALDLDVLRRVFEREVQVELHPSP